jgi:single-strand DNA-binding protein
MANIHFAGNLTKDPELKYGKTSAKPYVNLRVAENRRVQKDGVWVDGDATFRNVIAYGNQAENIAESMKSGQRVIVIGDERARNYLPEGAKEQATIVEVHAEYVCPSLEYGTTVFTSTPRAAAASMPPEYDEADIPPVE